MDAFRIHVDVSKNRGTAKWMVYDEKPLLEWMIWGYHNFRKHPCMVYLYIHLVDLFMGT